jgi:hypothetical protein
MEGQKQHLLETREGLAELKARVQAELVGNALGLSGAQQRRHKLLTLLALIESLDADYAARDAEPTEH